MEFRTAITGFPRIGENRELKKALESYWSGKIPLSELSQTAADLRKKHWTEQKSRGIDLISVNDFSFYDIMLDTAIMLGAVPARFAGISEPFDRCFSMARGGDDCAAMEMTKWFNTNYHYIVPELEEGMALSSDVSKIENEYKEAKALGITPKINIVGPITFTALSKCRKGLDVFSFFDEIFSTYKALLEKISLLDEKVIVQMEEPVFCLDSYNDKLSLLEKTYASFSSISERLGIIVTGYFEHFSEAVKVLSSTGIMGLGLDFVYGKKNMESLSYIKDKVIFAGVVDGRNIWKNDLKKSLGLLDDISKVVPKDRIIVSTSCSLLHVPYSVRQEPENKINGMFSFAVEKTEEVALLGKLFNDEDLTKDEDLFFKENTRINEEKKQASAGLAGMAGDRAKKGSGKYREGAFSERIKLQKELFKLPDLPTTTIGSFPQTPELRKVRRDYKKGIIESGEYKENIRKYIDECILFQEESGLDVLVHGEPERNDMVEYFGELLKGFHFTSNGWVQSYG
ncbi:MAG: 5-methyltetrahydropteroyltriglutamate--homocysteine S-methyltransferase, partial [Fibrobacterota bacterium]